MPWRNQNLIDVLKKGGLAVMPTDTIYGIVARAEDRKAVEKIYAARQRVPEKPCIVLIGHERELARFAIELSYEQKTKLSEYWPGAVSIIFECPKEEWSYLHRGTGSLAVRLPAPEDLRFLLEQTGPLVAPSANLEGEPPARNIQEAQKYFGDLVEIYEDGGDISGSPSRIIKLHKDGSVSILR